MIMETYLRQHRTIAAVRFGRTFPSIRQFEKREIHTIFLHVSNLDWRKNPLPKLLAELRGAALITGCAGFIGSNFIHFMLKKRNEDRYKAKAEVLA